MLLTFQDFQIAVQRGQTIDFIQKAIAEHRNSAAYKIAVDADEYDAQRNVTVNRVIKSLYDISSNIDKETGVERMGVRKRENTTASNHHIASNFFHRLNTDRAAYSLGNGITFDDMNDNPPLVGYEKEKGGGIGYQLSRPRRKDANLKAKLGPRFDTELFKAGKLALKHGQTFCFWNVDRLHVFPLTQFVPLLDESDGSLRAGIRFWSLDWNTKPVYAILYEEDGFTKFRTRDGFMGLILGETEEKRAYRQEVAHTEAGGDEIIGEGNYSALPIVPLYGNEFHQSTLVGMRAAIDAYDLIQSGFANDVEDCAQIYWLLGNAMGMDDNDIQHFMDRLRFSHAAAFDSDNSTVTPYTQEVPYNSREAFLARIEQSIYRDFGAFNPADVAAGNVTATQIRAAYQEQDIEADAFEYQIIECVQQILALQGLEGTPQFSRNRIANQLEETNMVITEAQWLDDETVLDLLPNITPDMKEAIMERKDVQDAQRLQSDDELEARVKAMVEDILKNRQETGVVEQDNNGGYRYVE